jgi:hypothetical protein
MLIFKEQRLFVIRNSLSEVQTSNSQSPITNNHAAGLVGVAGIEPATSALSGLRSNRLSYTPKNGGGNRVRTGDPELAKLVLYQLSYAPSSQFPVNP